MATQTNEDREPDRSPVGSANGEPDTDFCRARLIGFGDYVGCQTPGAQLCRHAFDFSGGYLCRHRRRMEIATRATSQQDRQAAD
jgi:hypothetical protein